MDSETAISGKINCPRVRAKGETSENQRSSVAKAPNSQPRPALSRASKPDLFYPCACPCEAREAGEAGTGLRFASANVVNRRGINPPTSGFFQRFHVVAASAIGCLVMFLSSCAGSGSLFHYPLSIDRTPELGRTPSASPFQPEAPSPTVTASPTAEPSPTPTISPLKLDTLRAAADRIGFGIGTVFQQAESIDPLFPPMFSSEFNTAMMTTFMKRTQPQRDRFDWSLTEAALDQAQPNHQTIIGGPLVYDNVTAPAWLKFDTPDCGGWAPGDLEAMMQNYIQTVVSKFGDQVAGWEVVNEPLTSGDNCWHKVLGDQYIDRAFQYAHAANPDALLMLNEAFGWDGVDKTLADQFFALVRRLQAAGVPIDVVGVQMHLRADTLRPTYPDEFQYFLDQAKNLGLGVWITEMDVYQGDPGTVQNPLDVQKNIFATIAKICLQSPICNRLIFWGISDRYTWLAHLPGNEFTDPQPLLFDGQFGEKPAFFGVLQALRDAGGAGGQ